VDLLKRFKKMFVYSDSDSVHCVYLKQKKLNLYECGCDMN